MGIILIELMKSLFGKRMIGFKSVVVLLLLSTSLHAAEIRGRIWLENNVNSAPPNSVLIINCGSPNEIQLMGDGSYSVRSLPANGSCAASIRVTIGGNTISSDPLPVRTNATVVNFNAEVIIANNNVVVMLPR